MVSPTAESSCDHVISFSTDSISAIPPANGANAVTNLVSFYKSNEHAARRHTNAKGTAMAGVALKGTCEVLIFNDLNGPTLMQN